MREPVFPLLSLSRLRMQTDGEGVTTLVAGAGCPLRCRYCLNEKALRGRPAPVTPRQLFEKTRIDDLYFQATGGGLTFGGGESLLNAEFIRAFRELIGSRWRIYAETSLAVPGELVETAAGCVDGFIVDIKDMDPGTYHAYTGGEEALMEQNLRYLLGRAGPENILVRVPLIPNFNDADACRKSVEKLEKLGVTRFDRFSYILRDQT